MCISGVHKTLRAAVRISLVLGKCPQERAGVACVYTVVLLRSMRLNLHREAREKQTRARLVRNVVVLLLVLQVYMAHLPRIA